MLNENDIKLQKVPANLTYLFQPIDIEGGPNGHAKRFTKKFTLRYAEPVKSELDKGKKSKKLTSAWNCQFLNRCMRNG